MRQFILLIFFLVLYTQGIGTRYGIPDAIYNGILLVLPFGFLFLRSKGSHLPPGLFFVLLYVIWATLSSIYNGEGVVQGIMFSRYLIIGYLILYAAFNSYFSMKSLKKIGNFIIFLFFLQLMAAINELLILERTESIVGTMTSGSGGLSVVFSFRLIYTLKN